MARPATKRKRSLLSRKKQRQAKSTNSTSNKKQGAGFYTVECQKHGKRSVGDTVYWTRVGIPKNKRQQTSGCPYCRRGK